MRKENLKAGLTATLDNDESYELKKSYYGTTDNVPGAIEALELASRNISNELSITSDALERIKIRSQRMAINQELEIFEKIQELLNRSNLGAIL